MNRRPVQSSKIVYYGLPVQNSPKRRVLCYFYGDMNSLKSSIFKFATLNALGTALYVACVAVFMSHTSEIFNGVEEKTALIPFAMLLLLVLSASVTGSLVLGRPILWYLDGKKKEAVTLFVATIGCLFVLTLIAFLGLVLHRAA